MARIIDDLLALMAATPLPAIEEGELDTPNDTAPYVRPKTRSQTRAARPSLKIRLPVPAAHVVKNSHSKKRKPNFTIFTDDDTTSDVSSAISTPKRSRTNTPRTPLSERTYSTNSTPAPSPRHSSTPFSLSPLDPYWENLENYAPFTVPATPPTTPPTVSPPSPQLSSAHPVNSRPSRPFTPSHPPPASPQSRLPPPPPNTLLYTLLGLTSWRATPFTIKKSYRRMARTLHPDKASSEEERVKANAAMQRLNAARDVLVDAEKRKEYHRTGVVDWVG
ncbi:hypothetical protein COCCADRAFT_30770 [Bipolaris zeicola 26-R-13]|uniref:J domain-containing protein n=1 Tax=Cochliobolus carbonum (strain 26-R-13) TaxID=930089 RepID=W6Y9N7_COCC2|nr:uncharacterized protein COCCADRAFT_30770 [Bipolaris zeicola 26-R-13]EUC27841.1 hypothetical protein COCCADRAFT_30770 [Bipolaris zeicola 26-R-13]